MTCAGRVLHRRCGFRPFAAYSEEPPCRPIMIWVHLMPTAAFLRAITTSLFLSLPSSLPSVLPTVGVPSHVQVGIEVVFTASHFWDWTAAASKGVRCGISLPPVTSAHTVSTSFFFLLTMFPALRSK